MANAKKPPPMACEGCGAPLAEPDAYAHGARLFCADCLMTRLGRPGRATHWRYIWSVKNDYLRP